MSGSASEIKMVVLYDDRAFRQTIGGVSRCFTEILRRCPADVEYRIGMVATENLYLQQPPFNFKKSRPPYDFYWFRDHWLGGFSFRGLGWLYNFFMDRLPNLFHNDHRLNWLDFVSKARQADVDVIHLTSAHEFNYDWQSVVRDKPLVVTVHDLIPDVLYGKQYVLKDRREVLSAATRIIAVSQYTKDLIVATYGVESSKIDVVYHGYIMADKSKLVPMLEDEKYLLYVGGRHTYKNFGFFIREIASLMAMRPRLKLICTGTTFNDDEKRQLREASLENRVMTVFASDEELRWLYEHAECMIYPSKMEGFGIPILEAFSAGCPIVLSRCSCFPEVAGDAALYFEDDNGGEMRKQVAALLDNPGLRMQMIRRGTKRLENYSWDRCARQTFEVYKTAIREYRRSHE